jgi:diguanylate cyclase (GGDEF)-like protein
VWKLPRWLIAFVAAVVAADVAGIVVASSRVTVGFHDLTLFGLLLACDVAGLELTRQAGESSGIAKDMHAVWELPVAILLPPAYAALSPIIRIALTQWRVRQGFLHRRVFSAAALGLSYLAASLAFHRLASGVLGPVADPVRHGFAWMMLVAACGLVQRLVNSSLVLTAVKGSDPTVRVRDVQFGREPLYNDLTELCLAVLVAFGVASSPVALLFAFPFATLPLRALRHAQLVSDSRTDSKTGLLNARTWEREAAEAVARAVRSGVPLAVAVLDLDWFKSVNDTYGHLFGDEVLRQIGRCLPSALREYDLAGRFGGEEFVLLLPHTRAVDAFRAADRVRSRIAGLPLRAPDGAIVRVTASVGVAALDAGSRRELTELLAMADAALYRAKRGGRNQVQMISTSRGLCAVSGIDDGVAGDGDGSAGGTVSMGGLAAEPGPEPRPGPGPGPGPGPPQAITRSGLSGRGHRTPDWPAALACNAAGAWRGPFAEPAPGGDHSAKERGAHHDAWPGRPRGLRGWSRADGHVRHVRPRRRQREHRDHPRCPRRRDHPARHR